MAQPAARRPDQVPWWAGQHGQMVSGDSAEQVPSLRRVYARQSDCMLNPVRVQYLDSIAICDRYNAPCDVSMGGRRGELEDEQGGLGEIHGSKCI